MSRSPSGQVFKVTVRNSLGGGTQEYSFRSGRLTIGRGVSCDIVLDSDRVSRMHAALTVRDGVLTLEDTGSANGVFVNEKRISSVREVRDDDVIRIGDYVLTVTGTSFQDGVYMRLKGISDGFSSNVVEFSVSPALIGRATEADIPIVHPSISRRHARVMKRHDGSVLISDLGSANGFAVNGVEVRASTVQQGDRLRVGGIEFLVELPGSGTLSEMPAPALFNPLVQWLDGHRRELWIVAIVLAAVAVMIAGWKIGGIRSESDVRQVPVSVSEPGG